MRVSARKVAFTVGRVSKTNAASASAVPTGYPNNAAPHRIIARLHFARFISSQAITKYNSAESPSAVVEIRELLEKHWVLMVLKRPLLLREIDHEAEGIVRQPGGGGEKRGKNIDGELHGRKLRL